MLRATQLFIMALQPDFTVISGGFDLLSQQFLRCAHLPAVDQGARFAQALEAINNQIMALRQDVRELRQDVRGIGRRLDTRWAIHHHLSSDKTDRS